MATSQQLASSADPKSPGARLTIDPLPHYPDIVLALNVIETSPPRFHWYFFVPDARDAHLDVQAGLKMHATTDFSPSPAERTWCFDAERTTLATDEGGLAAAAVVGRLTGATASQVDGEGESGTQGALRDLLARIPMSVPDADRAREPVFTCRVWAREALRRMHGAGYVRCPDVDAVEEEMWGYGRAAARAIEDETFAFASLVQSLSSRAA
ncbi:hypothetical protein BD311DRAFT_791751 [Dichomitus squalens]|uniref:Uncharacterized protein n=1 Tax=Dichomitus squalens TaxID=114155 RepID=A0A4V2JZ06_9APHY|nr:hypothetical protein BD311DRAFT_791751 [Dichomitus squalens]